MPKMERFGVIHSGGIVVENDETCFFDQRKDNIWIDCWPEIFYRLFNETKKNDLTIHGLDN